MKANPEPDYPVEVIPGQIFDISLESIPSAGYRWNVGYDTKVVDLKSRDYVSSAGKIDKKLVGGSGWEIFKFQARQPGETLIEAKYQRGRQTPLEIKLFKVVIRDKKIDPLI